MVSNRKRRIVPPLSLGLVIALLLSSVLFVNAGEYWHTSHGPEGGSIQALAVDTGGNLYAGTYRGWVFRGTFSGPNLLWTLKKGAIPADGRDIQCLAVDENDYVYAGTYGRGVYKSTNGGDTWTAVNTGLAVQLVRSLIISPTSSSTVYAGTYFGVYEGTVSAPLTVNWTKKGTKNLHTRALVVTDDGTLYAGCEATTSYWGVYRWSGSSWTAMNDGLPIGDSGNTGVSVRALVADGDTLYAGAEDDDDSEGYGVYWCDTAVTTTWQALGTLPSGEARQVRSLALDGSTLYAGTENGAYEWTGATWVARSTGLEPGQADSNAHRIRALLRTASNTLYAGTPGRGVYHTTDGGLSWETANGTPTDYLLSAHVVRAVAVNPAYDWKVYAGTEGGGVHRSQDGGVNWERRSGIIADRDVFALAVTHPSGVPVYAGTSDGIYTTTNGITWTLASNGLTTSDARTVRALTIDPVSATIVYAGTADGVFKTVNAGTEWIYKRVKPSGEDYFMYALAIDPITPTLVYAGTQNNGVYRSTDAGENWTEFNDGLPSGDARHVNALTVDIEHTVFAGTDDGIYGRKITSTTWQSSWPLQPVHALIINPITPTIVLAGTGGSGVLFYGDDRYDPPDVWRDLNAGLPNYYVYSLSIDDYVTQTLHAGTAGSGVFDFTWGPPPPPPPEMGISKSDGLIEASLGQLITYTINYANSGDEVASNIVITDVIPDHTVFVSSDLAFNTVDGRTYTVTIPGMGGGGSAEKKLAVQVLTDTATAPDRLTNYVYIRDDGSHGPDPREDNNADHDTTYIRWVDLQVSKSNGVTQVNPGQLVTYTIAYTNTGRSDADDVVLTEIFTGEATYVGSGWTALGGNRYSKNVGTVAGNGGSGSTTFVIHINGDATTGILQNRVEIDYDGTHGPDITPGDNVALDEDTIFELPPDLEVTKIDGVTYVTPGDILTYVITYTNVGAGNAGDIVITDTIPDHTIIQDGADWHLVSGQTYTRTVADLPASETASVSISVLVDETASAGPITNTVTIRATGEEDFDHNTATDTDWVVLPDLEVAKTDGTIYVRPGDVLAYTITYANTGLGEARGIVITDTIPDYTTIQNGADWHLVSGQTYTRTVSDLPADQTASVSISVLVSETASADPITNTVSIRAIGEGDLDHNTATDVDWIIERAPDLKFTYLSDGAATIALCQTALYTLRYTNTGDLDATGVAITATLPPSATYMGGGWTALGGHQYRQDVGFVAMGSGGELTLSMALTNAQPELALAVRRRSDRPAGPEQTAETTWPSTFTVQVVIGCAEPENQSDNTATDTNTLRRPDLTVTGISTWPVQPIKNQEATIYVTVANEGDIGVALSGCCNGFWNDLYVDPPHAPGAGEWGNVEPKWWGELPPGGSQIIKFTYVFTTATTYTLYAQTNADRYWSIPEVTYDNNTFGPFDVFVVEKGGIYLPLILRAYTD